MVVCEVKHARKVRCVVVEAGEECQLRKFELNVNEERSKQGRRRSEYCLQ
jgi:hypothetical protein